MFQGRPSLYFRGPGPTCNPFADLVDTVFVLRADLDTVFILQASPGICLCSRAALVITFESWTPFVLQGRLLNFVRRNTLILLLRQSGVSLWTRCVEMAVPKYLPNQNAASVHEHAAPFTNRSRTTCSRTPFTNMTNSVHHAVHEHSVQERSRTVQVRSFTNRPFTNNRTPFRSVLNIRWCPFSCESPAQNEKN